MVIVMLSHPTPPVSLFEARQLSIMFSQIDSRGCFATIPRLTNSITACEDWQSQIPSKSSAQVGAYGRGEQTVTCNDQKLVILIDIVYLNVWEGGDYLLLGREVGALLELEVAYRTRQGEVAVHAAKVDEAACCLNTGLFGWGLLALYNSRRACCIPSFCGLWSKDRGFARPLTPRTVLESPALAYCCETYFSKRAWQDIRSKSCLWRQRQRWRCSLTLPPRTWGLRNESAHRCQQWNLYQKQRTTEDSSVGCEEAVLERLFQVARLVGFLLCHNLVQVLARVNGHFVAAVSVVDTEVGQSLVGVGGLAALRRGLQV